MSASPTPPPSTKVRSIMASVRSDNQWRLLGEHSYSSELGGFCSLSCRSTMTTSGCRKIQDGLRITLRAKMLGRGTARSGLDSLCKTLKQA
ncbi:hypothetical protein MANES_16G133901v8 [Manihot esculenta]|uniref:Uncharacterized protein n=1 Tax=Manihot esculenta TaxID=3983 RepID=A0ACB7G889_MANES|nr:hypothetical protein MANES_16G133901v8 [Manihot esculenta]